MRGVINNAHQSGVGALWKGEARAPSKTYNAAFQGSNIVTQYPLNYVTNIYHPFLSFLQPDFLLTKFLL